MSDSAGAILLTGATGFLGSRLLRELRFAGYGVVVLKRSWSDTTRIADLLTSVSTYDLDTVRLASIFEAQRIDAVVHAATCYGTGGETDEQVVESNFAFPSALIDHCAAFGVETFVNSGTVLPAGLNHYALTKRRFMDYGCRIAEQHDLRFINVRLEHVYGPDDNTARFIPALIRACLTNQPTIALTGGEQRRDLVYIDDVVSGYLALLRMRSCIGKPVVSFELGSGEAPPLADVVRLIHRLCGSTAELRFGALPYRDEEVMHSKASPTGLSALGWSPDVALADGLMRTVEAEKRKLLT